MTSKNLEQTFTHNELYFASPKDVNDPFDCKPPLNFMDCTDEEFMILLDASAKSFFEQCDIPGLDKIINPERTKDIVLDMLKKVRIRSETRVKREKREKRGSETRVVRNEGHTLIRSPFANNQHSNRT